MKRRVGHLLFCLSLCFASSAQSGESMTIHCGAILDVIKQQQLRNIEIVISDGVIEKVGPIPVGANASIDLTEVVCLPGLIDLHAHLFLDSTRETLFDQFVKKSSADNALKGLKTLQTMLSNGFTTVRVPGDLDRHFATISLRNAIARGDYAGPRMQVAPHALSPLGGHADLNDVAPDGPAVTGAIIVPAGVDSIREAVRREVKFGADWIKIMGSGGVMSEHDDPAAQAWTDEEILAFADEAHRLGKKITAHVHGNVPAITAANAGFDSIEHGTMLEDDGIEAMRKNGTVLVPTVYVLDWIVEQGPSGGISEDNHQKAVRVVARRNEALSKAYKVGVPIAFGSDPIYPPKDTPKEFVHMVKAGIPPWGAIAAGTIVAAELLDLDDRLGSLEVGKRADIVAVPGDPVADIGVMESVVFVMQDGVVIRNDIE